MKGIVLVILIYIRDIPINCKMSKAMKTFHEGQKESFKKNNKLKIDFMELKQSLKTKYRSPNTGICTVNEKMKNIFISDLTSETEKLWVQFKSYILILKVQFSNFKGQIKSKQSMGFEFC